MIDKEYLETIKKRAKKSRVYRNYQFIGLQIADMLGDRKHKALYIKFAKQIDKTRLMGMAKDVSERKQIENKGGYFMRILQKRGLLSKMGGSKKIKTKQQKLKFRKRKNKNVKNIRRKKR